MRPVFNGKFEINISHSNSIKKISLQGNFMQNEKNATARQFSIRGKAKIKAKKFSLNVPLEMASRIELLCHIHPHKTRTQIILDLLELGFQQIDHAAAKTDKEPPPFHPDTTQAIYLLNGPFDEFHGLIHKHHLALEREMNERDTEILYPIEE
jgi:hypothetical protein